MGRAFQLLEQGLARVADGRHARFLGVTLGLGLAAFFLLWRLHLAQALTLLTALAVFLALIVPAAWLWARSDAASRRTQAALARQARTLEAQLRAQARADQHLQDARARADARNTAKSKYVRGMSHELRTPLNAVLGYAQLLEGDAQLSDTARHGARVIRRSSEHLSSLVDGLLDISMIEAGRLTIHREEVALPELLAQLSDMIGLQAREQGLAFACHLPPNLPHTVHTDEKRLRQILINLLSNAVRYTDHGRVSLRVSYGGQVARFDIEDTGLGIAAEDSRRIFEPFERINHPRRPARGGSGLGLTITRLLTEAMGGELTFTSVPGRGSCFTVRLMLAPVAAQSRNATPRGRVITGYEGARRRILAVDDDPNQTHLLQAALGGLGFEVVTADNGEDGLMLAVTQNPDAVLLDVNMPGATGWQMAARMREALTRRVPVIMISAYAPEQGAMAGAADHHDAYLMKPLRLEKLLDQLGRLLSLTWTYGTQDAPLLHPGVSGPLPGAAHLEQLQQLGRIGHLHGILAKLDEIGAASPDTAQALAALRRLTEDCDLDGYRAAIEAMQRAGDGRP